MRIDPPNPSAEQVLPLDESHHFLMLGCLSVRQRLK